VDKGHGRLERRTITTTTSLTNHIRWPGHQQVCRIVRERTLNDKHEVETAYFISSVSRERGGSASKMLALARDHWGAIENGLHYVRDTTMDEDRCTIVKGHGPENFAALRNSALNWLRLMGVDKFASTIRSFTRQPQRLFSLLDIVK
jgi:predicted transposase YbfD/YdcC